MRTVGSIAPQSMRSQILSLQAKLTKEQQTSYGTHRGTCDRNFAIFALRFIMAEAGKSVVETRRI